MSFPEFNPTSNFNFHLTNIKKLLDDFNTLKKIPNFPLSDPNYFYTRKDKQGWWMVVKQIVIRHYINEYLTIWSKESRNFVNLYFIDLLSSFGMNKVTKSNGKDEFIFPGSSINAALISLKKTRGFKKIYSNDLFFNNRKILRQRLESLTKFYNYNLELGIDSTPKKNDSNQWVIRILDEIKKIGKPFNYLMVIDNEGMNINYETINSIREIHEYGDIIINFQDTGIKRNLKLHPPKIKSFFGIEVSPSTKKEDLCDIYINQLHKIGLKNVEKLIITSKSGFYYTLLFCCRSGVKAKWLRMIKYYRDDRFKNWKDSDVKRMWDVAKGKVKPLDHYLY